MKGLLPCEEWRNIHVPELVGRYEVSSLGRVRSLVQAGKHEETYAQPRMKKLWPDKDGYLRVSLYLKRKTFGFCVHTLVLHAFVSTPSFGQEASHKNGDLSDNSVGNLAWETHLENEQHKTEHGTRPRGEKNTSAKLTAAKVLELRQRWANGEGLTTLAREAAVSTSALYQALKGETWSHV